MIKRQVPYVFSWTVDFFDFFFFFANFTVMYDK